MTPDDAKAAIIECKALIAATDSLLIKCERILNEYIVNNPQEYEIEFTPEFDLESILEEPALTLVGGTDIDDEK